MKGISIYDVALTTGSTVSIPLQISTSLPNDIHYVRVSGTQTLVSNFAISPSGTAVIGMQCVVMWEAACTPSGNTVTIFGDVIPNEILSTDFHAVCTYNGSAWKVVVIVDWAATSVVGTSRIESDAITTAKILAKAVTLAKIEDIASGQIIVGNASNRPAAVTPTGDVTITNAGVTAIGASKVLNSMINTMDAAKLTGTIDNARLSAVPMSKLTSAIRLATKYSDTGTTALTSEEILYNQVITGGEIDADGKGIRVTACGTFAANGNTKTVKCNFGGNTYTTNAVTTAPNGTDFRAVFEVIRTGSTSAVGFSQFDCGAVSQGIQKSKAGVTWANDNYVVITGQNGTAAVNDIVLSMVIVEKIH